MDTFAERIRAIRGSLSRAAFSEKTGISQRALVNYESGTTLPNIEVAANICASLGISAHWLLLGKGEMKAAMKEPISLSPAVALVDEAAKATGLILSEKQRAAIIAIVEEELRKSTARIVKAVAGG